MTIINIFMIIPLHNYQQTFSEPYIWILYLNHMIWIYLGHMIWIYLGHMIWIYLETYDMNLPGTYDMNLPGNLWYEFTWKHMIWIYLETYDMNLPGNLWYEFTWKHMIWIYLETYDMNLPGNFLHFSMRYRLYIDFQAFPKLQNTTQQVDLIRKKYFVGKYVWKILIILGCR